MLPPEIIVTVEQVGAHPEGGDQYLAVATRSNGAEICRNTFRFQPDLLVDIEPQWMLEKAVPRYNGETVKRGPANARRLTDEEAKLAAYGQRLYSFLFGDGQKLKAFLEFNDSYRDQARLTLALHGNAAALWRLPWEYLHDGQDFLVLHGRFLLSRVPHGLGQMQPPPAPLPLRILVVIAAPDDQKPLDTEEEIGVIQAALDEAVRTGRVQVEYLDDATLPAIAEALRRFQPHVLHYTGHGKYNEKAERSFLALEDDSGQTKPAGIQELRPHLKDAKDLRLVVLSGCHRPAPATWTPSAAWPLAYCRRISPPCWPCSIRSSTSRVLNWPRLSTPLWPGVIRPPKQPNAPAWPCGSSTRGRATTGGCPPCTCAPRRCA